MAKGIVKRHTTSLTTELREVSIGKSTKYKERELNDRLRKEFRKMDMPIQIVIGYLSLPENLELPSISPKKIMLVQLLEYGFSNLEEIKQTSHATSVFMSTLFSDDGFIKPQSELYRDFASTYNKTFQSRITEKKEIELEKGGEVAESEVSAPYKSSGANTQDQSEHPA